MENLHGVLGSRDGLLGKIPLGLRPHILDLVGNVDQHEHLEQYGDNSSEACRKSGHSLIRDVHILPEKVVPLEVTVHSCSQFLSFLLFVSFLEPSGSLSFLHFFFLILNNKL